jgi:hypothetical protein
LASRVRNPSLKYAFVSSIEVKINDKGSVAQGNDLSMA